MKENSFINKNDDWLKKERIRESKISVWDFDDSAKFLKDMHSENCDRQKVFKQHQQECAVNNHLEINDTNNQVTNKEISKQITKDYFRNRVKKRKQNMFLVMIITIIIFQFICILLTF